MDGESSYESDISESWSLIDVNINAESYCTANSHEFKKDCITDLSSINSTSNDHHELQDSCEKCEVYKAELNLLSSVNKGSLIESHKQFDRVQSINSVHKEIEERNEVDDVESIEILDIDGNYRDSEIENLGAVIDSLNGHDSQMYQSDGEKSLEEIFNNECCSDMIKRKRRKPDRNSEDTVNSVNSKRRSGKNPIRVGLSERPEVENFSNNKCEGNCHAVYKHCRNNFANTAWSLSVGIIFAGVTCIAIGHFLGMQDATETTGELIEKLKKLEVENAALQSQLLNFYRALLNQEINTKSGPPLSQESCENGHFGTLGARQAPNSAALPTVYSDLNSFEWLSGLQNLLRSHNKAAESRVDFQSFKVFLQDQLNVLKSRKENGAKFSEDIDKKISEVSQKKITETSTFQENIENLYNGLINYKDNLNHKRNKVFPATLGEIEKEKSIIKVSLDDLKSVRWNWNDRVTGNSLREHQEAVQFPQPEKYYQMEMNSLKGTKLKSRFLSSSDTVKKIVGGEKKNNEEIESRTEKNPKEWFRSNRKKKNSKKNEIRKQKQTKKGRKKKNKINQSEFAKSDLKRDFNASDFRKNEYSHLKIHFTKAKKKFKTKQSKVKSALLRVLHEDSQERCSNPRCLNSTGYWVFRWAGGREKYRRHQAMGEWQFERARGRQELRAEEVKRGAEWQLRKRFGRHGERQSDRWEERKELFRERFSWI